MSRRRNLAAAALAGAVAVLTVGVAAPAQAADGDATVSVLHGVPGATVDVYANGDKLLTDFKPGTLTDPTQLPAGTYDLKVTQAGAAPDSNALIEAHDVEVPAGEAGNERCERWRGGSASRCRWATRALAW